MAPFWFAAIEPCVEAPVRSRLALVLALLLAEPFAVVLLDVVPLARPDVVPLGVVLSVVLVLAVVLFVWPLALPDAAESLRRPRVVERPVVADGVHGVWAPTCAPPVVVVPDVPF